MTNSPNVFCQSAGPSRRRRLALSVSLAACVVVVTTARAGDLYTENFNSYSSANATSTQVTTGLTVAFSGTVTGWNRAGDGAIHAVRLATGNWAPMFYDGGNNNIITTASTIAGANTTNATYRVTFQVAPGVYANASQATTASDAVILSLLTSNSSSTLASGTFFPGAFANSASSGSLAFQTATFDYQGTGSDAGAINLRFAANNPGAQRFGGTVDNVILQTTARWNNGTSGNWSTGSNWLSGAAPVNTDLVLIGGTAGGTCTNDLSSLSAAGIEFVSGAGSFTVSGSAITLSGSNIYNGVTNASTSAQTLALNLVLGGTTRTFNSVGRLTVSGDISDGATSAGLTKTGAGTVVLAGTNTYTGTTAITAGALSISSTGALPGWNTTGRVSVASGASLLIGNSVDPSVIATLASSGSFAAGSFLGFDVAAGDRTVSTTLAGGFTLTSQGGNVLTLSGSNSYTGGTQVTGRMLLANGNALGTGTATVAGGVLDLGNQTIANAVALTSGTLTGGAFEASRLTPTAGTVSATLVGGALTKSTAGTVVLTTSNSYSGGTQLTAGTLSFAANALGSGSVTVSNAALRWASGNTQDVSPRLVLVNSTTATLDTNGNNVALATGFGSSSSAAVVKAGNGTLTLSASNSYTGGTRLDAGSVSFVSGGLGTSGAVIMNGNNTTLQWASGNTQDISAGGRLTLTNGANANFDTNGNDVTLATPFALNSGSDGGFAKLGAGTLTLTASNTYTGYTSVNAGTLEFANNALGTTGRVYVSGGSLRWATGNTQDISSRLWFTSGSTSTFDTNGNNVTFATGVGGTTSGILAKSGGGTLTLSASNSYTGGTLVNAGTILLGNARSLGTGTATIQGGVLDLNSQSITNAVVLTSGTLAGGSFEASQLTPTAGTVSATLSGGTLTKSTAGTVVLTASNSHTGGTRVNAGTLSFVTNALGSGTVTVSGGTLQWAAGNTQDVSSRVALVNATTATFDTNGNDVTFGSSIGGATTASVVKAGNGSLTLSASNTFTGNTTVSAGVLALSGSGKIYGGVNNGTAVVTVSSGAVLEFDKWDSGFADWGKGSFGQLFFSANQLVVNGGTLRNTLSNSSLAPAAGDGRAFTIGALGATLESTAGQTWYVNEDSRSYPLASNGGLLTLGGAGNGEMKKVVPGTGGVAMAGSGTWTLSAANTYSGNTSISAGTLQIGGTGVLGNGSYAGAIANAGTLAVATSRNQTLGGAISGVGSLAKSGAGVLTLSGSNFYTGGTQVMAGTVEFANGGLGGSGTIAMGGGGLRWASGNTQDVSSRLALVNATTATFDTNGNNAQFGSSVGGATTAAFVKAGAGTLTLSASNTWTGNTTVSAGVLAISGGGKIYSGTTNQLAVVTVNSGAVLEFDKWDSGFADWGKGSFGQLTFNALRLVVNGGTLRNTLSNSSLAPAANDGRVFTVGALGATLESTAGQTWYVNSDSRFGSLASNGGLLTLGGAGDGDMKNIVPGTGGLSKVGSGTWSLSAANTYSGATTINAGRLLVAAAGQINSTSGITLDGMGAELKYNSATALTRPISFSGSGGTLSGTGVIGSALALGTNAILSPGNSPGILTGTGGVAWNPGGTYAWEMNALSGTAGTNWDLLAVTAGGLDLSSLSTSNRFTLDLITLTGSNSAGPLDIGYVAGSTYEFLIASYNSLSVPGSFSTAANSDLTGLFTISLGNWQGTKPSLSDMSVKVNSTGTGLALVIVPEPGAVALAGIGVVIAGLVALRSRRRAS
ncbi:MAG: autotransporter-associated beta strand repeat-containing protein [Planctomycetia bacterium]|nr:autotransporter-associated beta strand repeat-containing protein [Planctomycetia bacterium]